MSRTLTAPPTDRAMWKRLIARTHPDAGGDHDLFISTGALYKHVVAGNGVEPLPQEVRRDSLRRHTTVERLDYTEAFNRADSFDGLTRAAVLYADDVGVPYESLLRMLRDCYEAPTSNIALHRQQNQGATYDRPRCDEGALMEVSHASWGSRPPCKQGAPIQVKGV